MSYITYFTNASLLDFRCLIPPRFQRVQSDWDFGYEKSKSKSKRESLDSYLVDIVVEPDCLGPCEGGVFGRNVHKNEVSVLTWDTHSILSQSIITSELSLKTKRKVNEEIKMEDFNKDIMEIFIHE